MAKQKIIKIKDYISPFMMAELLKEKGVKQGDSFLASVKFNGKRKKLKRLRFTSFDSPRCECCGSYSTITFSRGDNKYFYTFDTHLGNSNCAMIASLIQEKEK